MHVLTLTPFYPSAGNEVSGCFVAESNRNLQLHGATSTVVAVDSIYHPARKPNPQSPAIWIRYPQLPGNFGLATAGRFLAQTILNKIRTLHRQFPIDVIHAHAALPCGHAAAILSRNLEIPFVVTIHGLDVFNRCFGDGIAAKWRRQSSVLAYQEASRVICISKKIVELLKTQELAIDLKTEVVYNGTDATLFSPVLGLPEASPSLLLVGNLLAGKGQGLVLEAVAKIKDSFPTLRCQMIGEGADRPRFAAQASNLGIADRVEFLGRRGRADVATAMRKCSLFVLPSRFEGLGCVYLEAMACEKPAIACRGQGIEEIIRHRENGWLIPVDGLAELVDALRQLLSDVELRQRLGAAARQTIIDSLTLDHQSKRLMSIYRAVAR